MVRSNLLNDVQYEFRDTMSGGATFFLFKNMFTVNEARSLYMRNFNANLKAGPKIFTTNSNTITKFLELRPNQSEIGDDHVNAMLARCVLVEVKEKMYTHQQEDERDELEDDDWQTAKIEYDRCMGEGLL